MATSKTFGATTQVLGIIQGKIAFGGQISDSGVTANAQGRKIIPAGTPVGGADSFLENDQTALTVVNDATVQGILEHEVDVTAGPANGTVIVHGYININRLPAGVTISDDVKTALKPIGVQFIKRN